MNFQQNNGNTARLILFTRYPEPGKTKTRLIPALGAQGAADLQRQMTEHMLAQALPLKDIMPVDLEIRFTGGDRLHMQRWLGKGLTYTPQGSGDLGDRLERAFQAAFVAGAQRVVVTGIDCPDIDAALLAEAFQQLGDRDVVLGPATDGG
ncbi:MAG: glycosyltransferase, partial [Coleofasciculaceae cyanobacterium SM2_3_26]|nr:glycosyltransferase [Coleofasciculaceae cyanobacterium SM2_3_26]